MSAPRIGITRLVGTIAGSAVVGLAVSLLTIWMQSQSPVERNGSGSEAGGGLAEVSERNPQQRAGVPTAHPKSQGRPASGDAPLPTDGPANETGSSPDPKGLGSAMKRGDDLLREGNAAAALAQFNNVIEICDGVARDQLIYRIAVCQESLGDLESALENYRLLAGRAPAAQMRRCAALGQARIWIEADRLALAKPFLCELLIDTPVQPSREETDVIADASHLLGLLFTKEHIEAASQRLISIDGIISPRPAIDATAALQLVETQHKAAEEPPPDDLIKIEHDRGGAPDEVELSGRLQRGQISHILKLLAEATGRKFSILPSAEKALAGRTAEISVSHVTLARLLDLLLSPHDAVWQQADDGIGIRLSSDIPREEHIDTCVALARRNLQFAVSAYPDNSLAPSASLALGNIAFGGREFETATKVYQSMLRQFPKSRLRAAASFNRAKAHLQTADTEAAKQAFFEVVDSGSGHPCEPAAYVHLARLFLDEAGFQESIRFNRRAIALATDSDVTATAALLLAVTHLLQDQPVVASRVLLENRAAFNRPEFQTRAAFLSALARYRTATGAVKTELDGRMLIAAMSHVNPDDFLALSEYLLLAAAYDEVHLPGEALRIFETALNKPAPSPVRDRFALELAKCHYRHRNVPEARELLLPLTRSQDTTVARAAAKQLAEIALARGDDSDCLRYCHSLLSVVDGDAEKSALLNLMGRVYERRGDFQNAAICFSGMAPPREGDSAPAENKAKDR